MKKKILCLCAVAAVGLVAGASLTSCSKKEIFHIYAWNTEFQGYFNKYVSDEKNNDDSNAVHHLNGVEVKWTITPSDNGAYQKALDEALANNESFSEEEKVDMFLAEADYILKYVNSDATPDVKTTYGVNDFSQAYKYTVDQVTDTSGVVKGASFQCCPAGLIYRRSIAKQVLGTDDPTEVQKHVETWEKYNETADLMAAAGNKMTASFADTYRVYSNNAASPWVKDNKLEVPAFVNTWMDQAKDQLDKGETTTYGVWDGEKTAEFKKTGKTFCTFGPAWYYNFCMGPAMGNGTASTAPDASKKDYSEDHSWGDWAVVKGPQAYFWGGTWLLGAKGGNNTDLVGKTMNAFLKDEEILKKLVVDDGQFSNNKKVNGAVAAENETQKKGNGFLGGQNDTKIWVDMADSIVVKNNTIYDQLCNEGIQTAFGKFLKGELDSKEKVLPEFYADIAKSYPTLVIPSSK